MRKTALLIGAACLLASIRAGRAAEETVWIEAEHLRGVQGYAFADMDQKNPGHWGLSGPGIAPEWTQGGESEWLSITATPGDAAAEATYQFEVPTTATYRLWVRYRDWRDSAERFQVLVRQGGADNASTFGEKAIVDEDDQFKLLWKWAFAWDYRDVKLNKGPATLVLRSAFPDPVHRQLDAFCLTTDMTFKPEHREKPMLPAWTVMEAYRQGQLAGLRPLAARTAALNLPDAWRLRSVNDRGFAYLWNVNDQWLNELKKGGPKVEYPFNTDPAWLDPFLKKYAGQKDLPIFSDPRIVPTIHIPNFQKVMANDSPLIQWLTAHPDRQWGMLLNYGEPGKATPEATANFKKFRNRFAGYISGENLGYFPYDAQAINNRIKTAKSRREVLAALKEGYMAGNAKKYESMFGEPWPDAYREVIACQAAEMTGFAHNAFEWGARTVGYENQAVAPGLAFRLAFLRGGARQYGGMFGTYRSCNFGDSATMFSRQGSFADPKYVYDNWYDVWAGAGMDWYKFDIWTQYMEGSSLFYHEQGFDEFWVPAGGSTPPKEIQLSAKGRLVNEFLDITRRHPDRGTPYTPIAFLLDLAHGWDPNSYQPGAFGYDPALNEGLLKFGMHEQSLKELFGLAFYPYQPKEASINTGTNQIYLPAPTGDIYDVLVTASDPRRAAVLDSYPVVVLGGDHELSADWGRALAGYVQRGGTVLVTGNQLSGPGVAALELPAAGAAKEGAGFTWALDGKTYDSQAFSYQPITGGQALATTKDGGVFAASFARGKGKLVYLSVPRGLGLNGRAVPALSLLLLNLRAGQVPVEVRGDVEWSLNRTERGWIVTLLNPNGSNKPQHGWVVTDYKQRQPITITTALPIRSAQEWFTGDTPAVQAANGSNTITVTVPASGVRIVELN